MSDIAAVVKDTPKVADSTNILGGAITGTLSVLFGQYWILFAGFLVLNMIDLFTGCYKASLKGELSSAVGFQGAMRKVFYWVVIGMAFFVSDSFAVMGEAIGVNLTFVALFGWLTLATYLINEIRSVLENLLEIGVEVPEFLIKGLSVTEKLMEARTGEKKDE